VCAQRIIKEEYGNFNNEGCGNIVAVLRHPLHALPDATCFFLVVCVCGGGTGGGRGENEEVCVCVCERKRCQYLYIERGREGKGKGA